MTSLRDRLRASTAPRHDWVDRAYSALDLTQPDGLRTFLQTQIAVLVSVRCRPGRHAPDAMTLISRMLAALEADLHDLRGRPPAPVGERRLDATAVHYMLLGSSLGTRVLRRRWLQTTDPIVAAAGRYLELAPPGEAWRELCKELAQRSPQGTDADRIVEDAGEIFDLHLAALTGSNIPCEGSSYV